ncbi:MAG: hypothetical protein ACTH31_08510 [Pseudoclavibacter sp.]
MDRAHMRTGARTGAALAIALFLFAVVFGFSTNGILDQGRAIGLNAVDWVSSWENPIQVAVGFFVGLLGVILLGLVFGGWVGRRFSTCEVPAAVTATSAGWTIGLLLFLPWCSVPQEIGQNWYGTVSPVIWGPKEWVFYVFPVGLPAFGLVLCAYSARRFFVRYRRLRSEARVA